MIKPGTKVQVCKSSKFHAGEVGYLEFYGMGPSQDVAVIRTDATLYRKVLVCVPAIAIEPTI